MEHFLSVLEWLSKQFSERTLPKWALPFVLVCTVVGGAIGARMVWLASSEKLTGDIVFGLAFVVIFFAGVGLTFSALVLLIYQWISGNLTN